MPAPTDPPATVADLIDDRLYLVEEIAPLGRMSARTLREILQRAGPAVPVSRLGFGRTRKMIRIRGDIARALLNGEIEPPDDPTDPPAHRDGVYHDPVRRRRA